MLLLARRKGQVPLSTNELAGELNISISYLQQLSKHLVSNGLIKSRRGPYGGYLLNKPAEYISIGEVIRIMINRKTKSFRSHSRENVLWAALFNELLEYLDTFSIKHLVTSSGQTFKQDLEKKGNTYYLSKLII